MHTDESIEPGAAKPKAATFGATEPGAVPAEAGGHEGYTREDVMHHLPPQSIWPITLAGGVAIGGLGLVTTLTICIIGLLLMAFGLVSWVQELRHEPQHH
jgi:hypothetical protein